VRFEEHVGWSADLECGVWRERHIPKDALRAKGRCESGGRLRHGEVKMNILRTYAATRLRLARSLLAKRAATGMRDDGVARRSAFSCRRTNL
jgi:hypothetical protein